MAVPSRSLMAVPSRSLTAVPSRILLAVHRSLMAVPGSIVAGVAKQCVHEVNSGLKKKLCRSLLNLWKPTMPAKQLLVMDEVTSNRKNSVNISFFVFLTRK